MKDPRPLCILTLLALLLCMGTLPLHAAESADALPDAPQPNLPQPRPDASCLHGAKDAPACHDPARQHWLERFLSGPEVKPMTPREKARLAARNLLDPFSLMTIAASSGIDVAANPDSPLGPGMKGFGRSVGISFTQDMTGEFFGTFLICSIAHEDPHYHRMPTRSVKRRIGHAIEQTIWTQGDNGRGMVNYANLFGYAIGDEIGNLYVPGRATNLPSSAERYATGLATDPIDNFITEFLPDVAKRIHVRVVLIQRIINKVANNGSGSGILG